MKICFISGEYPPMQGGMGDYTCELARALAESGVEVHVITSIRAGEGEPAVASPEAWNVHPRIDGWSWHSLKSIVELLDDIQPAIVHIQYQTAGYGMHPAINFLPLLLRWRRPDFRTAITYHDLRVPYLFPKAGPIRWWVTLAPARWSHAVIVTNAEDWQKLKSRKGKKGESLSPSYLPFSLFPDLPFLELIPIGSNIHPKPPSGFDRDDWRARIGIGREIALLVYFGFLNESKGGETLIRGLDQLTRQGYDCRLVMLGGQVGASDPTNRAYLARVKALISDLGLTERVTWTGFIPKEQISAYLMASDLAVLPYRDGASFRRGSLMAALTHGMPVVTTRPREVKSANELPDLADSVNARLVPPDDPDALAEAVSELIDDPIRRRQLGLFARQLSQAFTWDKIAERHTAVYNQIHEVPPSTLPSDYW